MKKVVLLIALVAALGFACEPASAFFFGGGSSCGGGSKGLFGGGGLFGAKIFGAGKTDCGAYGCAPVYYGCYPAPCKVTKKKAKKAGDAAPKAKKEPAKKK